MQTTNMEWPILAILTIVAKLSILDVCLSPT